MVELIVLCITHFVSDLLLQSREMGKRKSSEFSVMFGHGLIICVSFFFAGLFVFRKDALPADGALALAVYIAVVHCIQDFFIWCGYKNFTKIRISNVLEEKTTLSNVKSEISEWKYWEDYWFYVTIGLDQLLHFITIVVLMEWLC